MTLKYSRLMLAVAVAVLNCTLASGTATAAAITYSINQTGWNQGGGVRGIFSGDDFNNDGFLNLANNEILSYSITFTGNGTVPAFTHNLSDLKFLVYTLGTSGFPPSFPLFSDNGLFFYDADDKVIGQSGFSGTLITTLQAAVVTVVPEPSTLGFLVIGFGSLLYIRVCRSAD